MADPFLVGLVVLQAVVLLWSWGHHRKERRRWAQETEVIRRFGNEMERLAVEKGATPQEIDAAVGRAKDGQPEYATRIAVWEPPAEYEEA